MSDQPQTWIWQMTAWQKIHVTRERAQRLRAAGETVWPAGHEDGAHLQLEEQRAA